RLSSRRHRGAAIRWHKKYRQERTPQGSAWTTHCAEGDTTKREPAIADLFMCQPNRSRPLQFGHLPPAIALAILLSNNGVVGLPAGLELHVRSPQIARTNSAESGSYCSVVPSTRRGYAHKRPQYAPTNLVRTLPTRRSDSSGVPFGAALLVVGRRGRAV